ncbi:dna polymerase i [Holotrichia oblita]|uniref:Dna polymerase i n=1 Tax=Holotrichia oblita TaxID=644536 RepID=A0ACB9SYW5_HOLOL|nr:dna polymerase i [Holotrichia oblita]
MNEHFLFNDTFDGISFSASGKVKSEVENTASNNSANIKAINFTPGSQSVTFDDSIFLSDSFTFSSHNPELNTNSQKCSEDIFNNSDGVSNNSCENNKVNVDKSKNNSILNFTTAKQEENTNIKCADLNLKHHVNTSSNKTYKLSEWNLPELILKSYSKRNISEMFEWQHECLDNEEILEKNKNLVYSAPTSAGGFQTVQMAICTIEKANSLVNRLLEENKLSDIGAVIVDEMHLIGDPNRGYLLELLLTKLNFMCLKYEEVNIQIIGMSATLPNLNLLADWLNAVLYTTNYRPIPLYEQYHVNGEIYDNKMNLVRRLPILNELETDTDNILQLCLETIENSCSVLIFCPTKNWCENLAQQIAIAIFKLGTNQTTSYRDCLRNQLDPEIISEVLQQLKRCPAGLDRILNKTISFGVAFHHAGLTMDERDIVEGAFRSGAIRILIATSTLSSGVNLPARRVIIRTPIFHGKPIDTLTYRQMIGRAGRMGKDIAGESLLICQKNDYKIAKELMSVNLEPIESCLSGSGKLKRAILEVIASGVVSSPEDVLLFTSCTLYANEDNSLENPVEKALNFLTTNQFIRLQTLENGDKQYVATSLGKACLSSSMSPEDGLSLFTELEKARQCFVLETELHLIYLVTPYTACNQWGNIDWMFYMELWQKLSPSMKRVGDLVGVKDHFLINASRGRIQTNTNKSFHDLQIHKRFFVSLALQDLVNEVPLNDVAEKFNCTRGTLQSLQQSASTFAGMVTSFSRQLGWSSVEILISQFQDRLHFGVNRDLLDLMRLPVLNGPRARALYNAGIETLVHLASAKIECVENALHKMAPFESEKEREGETKYEAEQRNKVRTIWVTGKQGLTEKEAAEMIIIDARKYLELEMGVIGAKWDQSNSSCVNQSGQDTTIPKLDEIDSQKSKIDTGIEKTKSTINVSCNSDLFQESNNSLPSNNYNDISNTTPEHDKNEIASNNFNDSLAVKINWSNDSLFENSFEMINITSKSSTKQIIERKSPTNIKINEENPCQIPTLYGDTLLGNAFASSFTLLDSSNQKNKSMESSTPTNSSNECICSSQALTELLDTPLKTIAANRLSISAKKRNRSSTEDVVNSNSEDSCLDQTPVKKKKILNKKTKFGKKSQSVKNINFTFIISENPDLSKVNYESLQKTSSVDLSNIEIINVCSNRELFKCFCKELREQKQISLSLGCIKLEKAKPKIGKNILNEENPNHDINLKFQHENRQLKGISIAWGSNTCYYVDFDSEIIGSQLKIALLKNTLKNPDLKVKLFDSKEQIKLLKLFLKIDVNTKLEDPKVADWLLEPEGRERNLQAMIIGCKVCTEAIKLVQLAGGCKGVGSIGLDSNSSVTPRIRSAIEAVSTWHIVNSSLDIIAEQDMRLLHTYYIEMACILILAKMELHGFCVDQLELQNLSDILHNYCKILENKAYRLAGRNFSFTSPTDVARILGMSKNGRRVSTNKQALEKSDNPIASLIVQWRKINCVLTKMVYPFLKIVQIDRIYGNCITFSATGRISMQEPNLQTIPRDFEFINPNNDEVEMINCRDVFKTDGNCVLISADYCQLELRLLAHLSRDPHLCTIMRTKEDVFKSIAAKLNNIVENQVTDQLRQRAKQICYGIIYGMGVKALSEQLNSSEDEAKTFLEEFHNKYPAINIYIKQVIAECNKEGYVVTIAGRRRYLPHINHQHAATRSQAERQAVNTTIQGSAADIAKNAMVVIENHIQEKFKTSRNKPKLILQLHDEFLYETPEKYANTLAKILKRCMENSVQLEIPFPVKIKQGKSWGSLKELNL